MKEFFKQSYLGNKEIIQNSFWRGFQIFGKQGVIFLIFILCARLLDPYDFGIYNYILAVAFFLIMFGDFGISTATSKFVAEYNAKDKGKLKSVLFNSAIIVFSLAVVISVLTLAFGELYLKEKYTYILYLLPLIFLAPMTSLYDGVYRGLKNFKKLAKISVAVGIISIFFVFFLVTNYGLIGALISQNLFYFLLLTALALGYKDFEVKVNKQVMKEVGTYSFTFGIAIVGYYLFSRVDILILGHYGYIQEIAVYELINRIFMVLILPFTIIGEVLAPGFTVFYAKKLFKKIYDKFKKYIFISLITGLFFALLSLFVVPLGIKLFFEEYYNELFMFIFYPCVIIYSLRVYVVYINSGIIVATGYASLMTKLNIWLGIFNLVLSLVLLNFIGYIGVIYATMISLLIGSCVLHWQYFVKIKKLKNEDQT